MKSVLDELDLSEAGALRRVAASQSDDVIQAIAKAVMARAAWKWFGENADRRIKIKVWIFRPSVKVGELRDLLEWLFGPPPVGVT